MSDPYLKAVENSNRCVGEVLAAFPDRNVLLLSDHGGHDRTHGTECDEEMLIPWVAVGKEIRVGYQIEEPVVITQTAPTAAKLLGLNPPREWDAQPVLSAFA